MRAEKSLLLLALFVLSVCIPAADGPAPIDTRLTAEQDATVNRLAQAMLDTASEVLLSTPPALPEAMERRLALHLIDGVLHDPQAAFRPPVQEFFKNRMDGALNEIENLRPDKGAIVWKLYNQGFVIRTPEATIGVDLIRGGSAGPKEFPVFNDVLGRMAQQCDVLFITNQRESHADDWVAKAFLDLKKPVVAPPGVILDKPFAAQITRLERSADKEHELQIQDGKKTLKVIVFPGRHFAGSLENNFYLVKMPGGISFVHTGDQDFPDDQAWIAQGSTHGPVDLLLPNCGSRALNPIIEGFKPKLIIPAHEHELGHPLERRDTYAQNYERLRLSKSPFVMMTWGESYRYSPAK